MDGRLHLASIGSVAAAGGGVVGAVDLDYFSLVVLHHTLRGNEIAVAEPYFAAGRQAVVLLGRVFAEIVLLDVEDFGEWHFALAGTFVFGIVDGIDFFGLTLRIVIDHDFQRAQNGHHAWRALVEVLANVVLEHGQFERAACFRYADGGAEIANCLGWVSTPPNSRQCWHARIVPSVDVLLLHQLQQFAFAQERVGEA